MRPEGPSDPSELIACTIFESFWVERTLDMILTSVVSNSHFGKRPVARDMTIFGSNVGPHVSENVCLYL